MNKIQTFIVTTLCTMGICSAGGLTVAKIGETTYSTLEAAVSAASTGSTIEIIEDINCGRLETGDKNLTFKPANKNITVTLTGPMLLGNNKGANTITLQGGDNDETLTIQPQLTEGVNTFRPIAIRAGNSLVLNDGVILTGSHFKSESAGGGFINIAEQASLTMNGGTISNSEVVSTSYDKNNSQAGRGGAIYVAGNGNFTMFGGEIKNCTAAVAGGAIFSAGAISIYGGKIDGNSVSGVDDEGVVKAKGGAIYLYSGTFFMIGGEITGNSLADVADMRGAGVYVAGSASVTLGSKAVINDNFNGTGETKAASNLFLYDNTTFDIISIKAVPTEGMKVGVSTKTLPTHSAPVDISTETVSGNEAYFFADNDQYAITFSSNKLQMYAQYSVTVSVNDTSMGEASTNKAWALEGSEISLTATPKDGYHFVKWESEDCDATTGVFEMPAKDVAVKAVFAVDINSWTVVGDESLTGSDWDAEDSSNDMSFVGGAYSLAKKNVQLEAKTYEYKFTANHARNVKEVPTSENYSVTVEKAGTYNVTFYMDALGTEGRVQIDEVENFNVTYNVGDGKAPANSFLKYYYSETEAFKLPVASDVPLEGWTFAGWFENESLTGDAVTEIPAKSTGDKEFFAKYTKVVHVLATIDSEVEIEVEITYLDGASDIEKKIEDALKNHTPEISLPTKDEDGKYTYTFKAFAMNQETGRYEPTFTSKPQFIKITFNMPESAKLTEDFKGYTYGVRTELPEATMKDGWEFKGWYTKANGEGKQVSVISETENSIKELYALFQKTIKYDANGKKGSFTITYDSNADKNIEKELKAAIPEDYTKKEKKYTFDKWVLKDGVYTATFTETKDDKTIVVAKAAQMHFNMSVEGRTLLISGALNGAKLAVFDMQGRLVTQSIIESNIHSFDIAQPGNYIIRVNNQATRVNVK